MSVALPIESYGLTIRSEAGVDGWTVELFGELDAPNCPEVEAELTRLRWAGADEVVLDLSALHFIDSAGVRCLIGLAQRSRQSELPRIRMLRAGGQVARILELSGVDERLPFYD